MIELPCPHCGYRRQIQKYGMDEFGQQGYHVACPNAQCLSTGPLARTPEEAIAKDGKRMPVTL